MSKSYDHEIMKRAKQVWQVMHDEAYKRGMAVQRDKTFGDGRVIINTVGAFIKGLSKERSWDLDQNKVDLVRRYLKATGNVVVLTKVEQYKFRIFIRETWHEGLLVTEPISNENPSRADKISPHDAGEDRDPEPVTYKCGVSGCNATYDTQNALNAHKGAHTRGEKKGTVVVTQERGGGKRLDDDEYVLAETQVKILKALKELGGSVSHEHGRVSSILQQATPLTMKTISSSVRSIAERGYVDREVRGKRTYRLWLTKDGKEVLKDLDHYRASNHVIADYLAVHGAFTAPKGKFYEALGETMGGMSADRVTSGVHRLANEGLIEILRNGPSAFPHGIVWKGEVEKAPDPEVEELREKAEEAEASPAPPAQFESATDLQRLGWMSDRVLLGELSKRLTKPKIDPQVVKDLEHANEKIDLVRDVIEEVNAGTLTPLKALGDIEATLNL